MEQAHVVICVSETDAELERKRVVGDSKRVYDLVVFNAVVNFDGVLVRVWRMHGTQC